MSPDEIRAAIAQVKETPAALYEFRKHAAMTLHAALLSARYLPGYEGPSTAQDMADHARADAEALIAALALELEPAAPAAPPPSEEHDPEAGRIPAKEWKTPREIVFVDHGRGIFWGERGLCGQIFDTTADGSVFEAIERQYRAGNESGRVDVMGIPYAFQRLPQFD